MTLRQQYAGPRRRAIATTGTSHEEPQLPLTPAHRDRPPRQPGLRAQLPRQPRQSWAGRPHHRAHAWNSARRCGPAIGWTLWRGSANPATPLSGRPATGSCHSSRHPSPPVHITGVQPAPCAAGSHL